MSSNISPPPVAQTDDEAAGLLMLFSTQSKKQITSSEISVPAVNSNASNSPPAMSIPPPAANNFDNRNVSISSNESQKSQSLIHRRGSSIHDNVNQSRVESAIRSPGPASAALARGDSSNKAIVAAAALAAAAATPIPIVHKPLSTGENSNKGNTVEFKTNSVAVKVEPKQSLTDIKVEEPNSAALDETEPEDIEEQVEVDVKSENTEITTETSNTSDIPSYAVGPDAGIIGCVCGYDHDDGLTIQCDKCFRWQHLVCMGFESITDTPDDFQCNLCNKNMKVDANKARKIQEAYLKEEKSKRKKSPYVSEPEKEVPKNVGAPQFKKKKSEENTDLSGTDKHSTLYYPIDYFIYKSPTVKSLFNQLPDILRKEKSVIKVDRGSLSKYVLNSSNLNIKSAVDNRTKFLGISKLGLYTTKNIKENSCVSLISGEIDTKENYILDKVNRYWLLGCPKPHVIFHPDLPIVIDQRGLGNYTRFIRKSCRPNCVVKTVLIGKNEVSMGVFATKEIKADQEITLGWEWDASHPIIKMINDENSFESLDNESKTTLVNSVQSILEHAECACPTNSDCVIMKVKKAAAYMLRNTRKNNIPGPSPTPHQKYMPIEDRLNARNKIILGKMHNEIVPDTENPNDVVVVEDANASTPKEGNFNFKFKPKSKNTLYNLHILPKQFELLKKYVVNQELVNSNGKIHQQESDMMPIPIPVNPKVLKVLEPSKEEFAVNNPTAVKKAAGDSKLEDRPKVKKFSLADYKKKKTG